MKRSRPDTAKLDGNQDKIDELEYFLEGIGRALLGPPGEDFRLLAELVPRTRNLSALVSLALASGKAKDIAEDLRFLHGELEGSFARGLSRATPDFREAAVFRYHRYLDLMERPEQMLDRVTPQRRLEVATRIARGVVELVPGLTRMNALAWLSVLGLPDLERELRDPAPPLLTLADDSEQSARAITTVLDAWSPRLVPGLREYYAAVRDMLAEEYRGQLARLAATTERLA